MERANTDALLQLTQPNSSPTLTILREAVGDNESFTLKHTPMECPAVPELARRVPAGRRAHALETLTDLKHYIEAFDDGVIYA